MTASKLLAIEERKEWESASAANRRAFSSRSDGSYKGDIGEFIHGCHPEVMATNVSHQSRLLYAGDRADILWKRIDDPAAPMPLSTAVRILRQGEQDFRSAGFTGDVSNFVKLRLEKYDSEGSIRHAGGKVFRTQAPKFRRIATGEAKVERTASTVSGSRSAIREAIAFWVGSRMMPNDPRIVPWVEEVMREIDTILDTYSNRLQRALPDRKEVFGACDLLNVPRPKFRRDLVDQKRAWKNRRSALRATHPDSLGHDGGREAFQQIKDAYEIIVVYNDSISGNGKKPKTNGVVTPENRNDTTNHHEKENEENTSSGESHGEEES